MSNPPCKELNCTACCQWKGDKSIVPEIPIRYKTQKYNKTRIFKMNEDGNCIYLDCDGCSIHREAPRVCKNFDCAILFDLPEYLFDNIPKHIKEAAKRRVEYDTKT